MMKVSRRLLVAAMLVALGGLSPTARIHAQAAAKGEQKTITTIDGVSLHTTFYASPKKDAPTVILLHPLGDLGGHTKNCLSLAQALQPNYSVMTFDFRGHGKSKDIDAELFRKYQPNQHVKGGPNKTTIEFNDFPKTYYPVLCNDIASVKAYLDRKNDTGACNTSSTILIGAETGATLGAIWLNAQWSLYRMVPDALLGPQIARDSEGKDVVACVWLSIAPKLGAVEISVARTLAVPVKDRATATVFIYGNGDPDGKRLATSLEKSLKDPKNNKFRYVVSYAPKGNTKLKGMKLLSPDLGTKNDIIDYLDDVVGKKNAESIKRDFRTTNFVWKLNGGLIPAKQRAADMNNFLFESYGQFIGKGR
jgi:pimeloyl-ACP methyl ester carboxylesterase